MNKNPAQTFTYLIPAAFSKSLAAAKARYQWVWDLEAGEEDLEFDGNPVPEAFCLTSVLAVFLKKLASLKHVKVPLY